MARRCSTLLRVLGQVRIKRWASAAIGSGLPGAGRQGLYSSRAIRALLRLRGIKAVIPEKTVQQIGASAMVQQVAA